MREKEYSMTSTILFVCPHGAGKSRMAAAFFNQLAPVGWRATSAGQEPQEALGTNAIRLLAGTPAEPFLDRERPRPIAAVAAPDRVVAIDCDVPGAARWTLENRQFDDAMRDEIRGQVETFAATLAPA
jgi:protein-tyrosine-phosphatase